MRPKGEERGARQTAIAIEGESKRERDELREINVLFCVKLINCNFICRYAQHFTLKVDF